MSRARALLVVGVPLALALVPPLLVAQVIARHGVNVPLRDQWRFAPDVIDFVSGRYEWARLWALSGQHRIVAPRTVMVTLAGWTHWDVRAEMWFDFGLAVAGLALLADLARRTLRPVAPAGWAGMVAVASACLFSLAAWQTWTFGWMMGVHLAVFGAVAAAWALGRHASTGGGLALVLLGAALAAFSYLSGVLLLVLGPAAAALLPSPPRRGRDVLVATAAAAALLVAFSAGYPTALVAGSVASSGPGPGALAAYVLEHLGMPFAAGDRRAAVAWGASGLIVLVASAAAACRSPAGRRAAMPWLLLAAFAVANGAATGSGRHAAGPALLSRYAMPASLFWIGTAACAVVAASAAPRYRRARRVRAVAAASVIAALALGGRGWAATWRQGLAATQRRSASLAIAAGCVRDAARASDACLRRLCRQDPALVRRVAPELARLRLGPFADDARARSRRGRP